MTNQTETTEKKQPSHLLYIVTPRPGSNESNWLRVGAAWPTKEGKGFSLVLEHPLSPNGQYAMMKYEPKAEQKAKA